MTFDIRRYYNDHKDFYGDTPLEEVAKDAYKRGFNNGEPDFNTWRQSAGIDSALEEDRRLRNPTFEDKLRSAVDENSIAEQNLKNRGDFTRGVARGVDTLQATLYGFAGITGSALGIDKLKEYGFEGYKRNIEEAQENPQSVTFDELSIKEPLKAGKWGLGALGELAPSMAEAATTAVAGAVMGSTAAPVAGTAVGGVAGFFGKQAAKKLIKEAAESYIEKGIAKNIAKEMAEKEVSKIAQHELVKSGMKTAGAKAGVFAGVMPLEAGGNWGELLQEKGIDNPFSALATGTAAAFLEFAGGNSKLIGKVLGGSAEKMLKQAIAKGDSFLVAKIAKQAAIQGGQEYLQEAGQEFLSLTNTALNDPTFEMFTTENLKRLNEAGWTGFIGGGVGGVFGEVVDKVKSRSGNEETEKLINNLKIGATVTGAIDKGLRDGNIDGDVFAPSDAVTLIQDAYKYGIYNDTDLDRFKDKYPQLRDGLNGVIVENLTKKVEETVTSIVQRDVKQIPWQDFTLKGEPYQEGVTVGQPYGGEILRPVKSKSEDNVIDAEFNSVRKIEAPKGEKAKLLPGGQGFELSETNQDEITTLQERIQKVQSFLDKNEKHKGGVKYQQIAERLDADKVRLAELTKGGEQNGTLQTETTVEDLLAEQDKMEWKNKPVGKERDDALLEQRKRADQIGSLLKIGDIILDHNGDYFGTIEHTDKTGVTFAKDDENPNGAFIARKEFDSSFVPDRDNGSHFSVKHSQGTAEENKGSRKPLNALPAPLSQTDAATVGVTDEAGESLPIIEQKERRELESAVDNKINELRSNPETVSRANELQIKLDQNKKAQQDIRAEIETATTTGERLGLEIELKEHQDNLLEMAGQPKRFETPLPTEEDQAKFDASEQKQLPNIISKADNKTDLTDYEAGIIERRTDRKLTDEGYVKKGNKYIYNQSAPEAAQEGKSASAAKQPWEMTKKEYANSGNELSEAYHFNGIVTAIREGKPVPESVLKDYPELQKEQETEKTPKEATHEKKTETLLKKKREAAIEKYRAHITESNPKSGNEFADKIVKMIDSRDGVELRKWMNGINPRINKLFYDITGLPARTQKEVDESLRSLNTEKWDKHQEEKAENHKQEIAKTEAKRKQRELDDILDKKIRHNGKILPLREFYDAVLKEGYTEIKEKKMGIGIITRLSNPKTGAYFNIKKKVEADYVKQLIQNNKKSAEEIGKEETSGYGESNKLFTKEKADKARALLKEKLKGTQLNVGIDPEILTAGIDLAGYHIEAGAREFTAFAKSMIADIGDTIKPYLKSLYLAVRNYPGMDKAGMNTEAELDKIDVNNLDATTGQQTKDTINITPEERKGLDTFYKGKVTAAELNEDQNLTLTSGPAGAGKSTTIPKEQIKKHVHANADLIRSVMGNLTKEYHERASELADFLLNESIGKGYHVVYDSQMTNYAKAKGAIEKVLKNGGDVTVGMTDIEADTSIVRSAVREQAIKEGLEEGEPREVPPDVSIKGYNYSLPTFIQLFKDYRDDGRVNFILTNNNADIKPGEKVEFKLIFRQINGKLEVFDFDTQKEIENKDKATETLDKILNMDYIKDEGGKKYVRNNKTDLRSQNWPEIHQRINGILNDKRNASQKGRIGPESGRGRRDPQQPAGTTATGGVSHEHPADGSTGEGALESDESGNLPADGRGQGTRIVQRSGGQTDNERNQDLDVGGLDGAGSLAGEPSPIHLPDSGSTGESVSAGTSAVDETPASEPRTIQLSGINPGNYRITEQDDIGSGTRGQKIDRNISAIRLIKKLDQEHRYPTKAEQAVLAKYVGWGGIKNVFDETSNKPQDQRAYADLKELLTKEEFFEARQSVLNAHYTSPQVIRSIYKVMRHFGFTGGNILEPTYGVGNFIGLMPEDMAASSKWYGSELDPITAKIGQYLYPDSQLLHSGFQTAEFPYGKFDAEIGNPPFGDIRISDTRKDRAEINRMKIHNYVISKSGLHLRPGGISANVITTRFLDTADSEARDFLAKNFKFLGAVRLPNDAFAKNAGTEVTTDLVFFQRLMPGEKPDMSADWLTTGATMTNKDGEEITLNKYFAEHPEMMLGEPSMKGTMYGGAWKEGGKGEFTLNKREGEDIERLIDGVIENPLFSDLKDVARSNNDKLDAAALSLVPNKEDVAVGGFFADKDRIYMREDNDEYGNPKYTRLTPKTKWTEKQLLGETRYNRIKGMLAIRAKAYELVNAERFDLPGIEALRKELNELYDAFVKEHGFINESSNFSLMSDDVKIEFGLEIDFKKEVTKAKAKALGIKPSPASAVKSTILNERMFYPEKEILYAKDSADGYNISLSQKGKLDIDYIAKLTGTAKESVIADLSKEGLIYQDPDTKEWIQEDEYLSGNVKEKHKKVEGKEGFEKNAKALKAVFPADVPTEEIFANPGATWIPAKHYEQFGNFIGVENPSVSIYKNNGQFVMRSSGEKQNDINVAWHNKYYALSDIFNAVANNKVLIAWDGTGDDRVQNKEQTAVLANIVKTMRSTFFDWVFADETRSRELTKIYNDTQNTHAKRKSDGAHLQTVGASPAIILRNTQRDAAWRIIQSKRALLDHCVGAGKTYTLITGVQERVRMGLTRKAMLAVPNHLVGQWAADYIRLYPGARILAATKKDFSKPNRRRLFARIATGKYDAVIVGHSSFGFIPLEPETITNLMMEEIAQLEASHLQAEADGNKRLVKTLANRIAKKREKITELLGKPKDNVTTLEAMGIDHLVIDEYHDIGKNLEYSSAMQNITGMGNPMGSKKAFDLYSKVRWLTAQKDYALNFATGTPISNSLVEMYALLRYMNRDALYARGVDAFDSWANTYASIEPRIEYTASQKLKQRTVMATFNNLPELLQLYEEFADIVTMADLKRIYAEQIRERNARTGGNESEEFPIPKVIDGGRALDVAEPSQEQTEYVDFLVARAERLEELGRQNDPKVDNHLWIMSDARKMALDVRLVDPTAKESPNNKINRAAKKIKAIYDRTTKDKGTQLVFCDLSTPSGMAHKNAAIFIREALKKARLETDARTKAILDSLSTYQEKWGYLRNRLEAEIESLSDHSQAETDQFMKRREEIEDYLEKVTDDVTADLTTADTGFSVYDDLKSKLIMAGIPEGEVKFIHDANTDPQKQELFDLVNAGKIRVLLGSSQKMGAGMNVQERLVWLHHMDAPWRPSDVEQREGRLVRQGNKLYEVDPVGFQVGITAYSTSNTFDAVMWQILARKGGMLDDFRSGRRSVEEVSTDGASYSDFMAETTGNPAFKEKFQLEGDIETLTAIKNRTATRLRSAQQSLDYNKDARIETQAEIEKRDKIINDLKGQSSFAFEGKTYKDNAKTLVEKEADEIAAYNDKVNKEYNNTIDTLTEEALKKAGLAQPEKPTPYWEKGGYGIREVHEYQHKLDDYNNFFIIPKVKEVIAEAVKGIKKPTNKHFHSAKLSKSDKTGVIAAGLKMVIEINNLDEGETFTYQLGNTEIVIKKEEGNRTDKKADPPTYYWDFVVTADGTFLERLSNVKDFDERNIWNLLNVEFVNDKMAEHRKAAANYIERMDKSDEISKHTLESLKFKDDEKLQKMKSRYQEVLAEVQKAEQEIGERRASTGNKYIENDRPRFPDGVWNPKGNNQPVQNNEMINAVPDPAKDKFYHARNGKDFNDVSGSPVDIIPGLEFFIYKEDKTNLWWVVNRDTGLSLGVSGKTKKAALDAAKNKVDQVGEETVRNSIKGSIERGTISPWYKAVQAEPGSASNEVIDEDIETIKAKRDEIRHDMFDEGGNDPDEVAQQLFNKGYTRLTDSETIQVHDTIAFKYADLARYEAILSQEDKGNIKNAQANLDLAQDRWNEWHEGEAYPHEIKLAQTVLNSIRSGQGRLFNGHLYSGLDITQTLNILRGLKGNVQAAYPHIERIGRKVWEAGNQTREKWFAKMKEFLGDLWDKFKYLAREAWNKIREERGSISFEKKEGNKRPVQIKIVDDITPQKTIQKKAETKQTDPPVSRDPKVLNLYLKDETDAIVQTIMNKLHPKSMTWLETMLKSPEWFDHPQIQNIVKLFMRDRNEIYHETFNELNAFNDSTVTDAAKALRNKGLSLTERLSGKVSPEYQTLMDMIDDGDTRWVRNKKIPLATQLQHFEDAWRKKGATDEIINVWRSFRQSYDKALDLMTKQLRDMIEEIKQEAIQKGEKPDLSELNQTLRGALAQMEEWRGFYAPRQRQGNWAVQAYKEHGPMSVNREWHRAHHGSELAAQREAKKLERDGWKIYKVGEVEKLPEDIYQDVKAVSTAKLIDTALDKLGKKSDLDTTAFNEEVLREVSNMIKSRGFRSTMIHRGSGNVVRGFIEDPIERHLMYINSVSGGISKARVARMAMNELLGDKVDGSQIGGIDPAKDPKAFSVAQDYIQEQLRNADASDRIIGLAKSIATFKFLGFNLRSLAVNTTAILTTAPAAIHQYATGGKGSFTEIFRELAKAGKDYGAVMAGKDLGNPDEAAFIADVHKKGWDDAQYTREALGEMSKLHNKAWSAAMDASMWAFGKSEQWNRGTTMLAAYRVARKQGLNHAEAADRAKTSSDKAHGVYGKSTMPMWAQGTNPAAKIGQMMYVYSKFGHNYLQMLYDMGFKQHNVKGAMFAFLSPLVLAGGAALPFKDAIFGLAGAILSLLGIDDDPEKWVWDQIREHLGGEAEKLGRHGLTGAMGVDISGSLSIGVGVPKDFIDLTGAIGGVATEIKEAGESLGRGQYSKAAEHILPTGFANPVRAYREAEEGVTTRNNRRVWNEKGRPYVPEEGATAARALGFRSTEQAVLSERTWEGHRQQSKFADKRNSIYERYRAWLLGDRDREEYKEIVKEVQDFNAYIRRNRIRGESFITSQSLKNQVRRMQRPSRKERSILEE